MHRVNKNSGECHDIYIQVDGRAVSFIQTYRLFLITKEIFPLIQITQQIKIASLNARCVSHRGSLGYVHLVEVGPHARQHDAEPQRHLEHGEVYDVDAAPALAALLRGLQRVSVGRTRSRHSLSATHQALQPLHLISRATFVSAVFINNDNYIHTLTQHFTIPDRDVGIRDMFL